MPGDSALRAASASVRRRHERETAQQRECKDKSFVSDRLQLSPSVEEQYKLLIAIIKPRLIFTMAY